MTVRPRLSLLLLGLAACDASPIDLDPPPGDDAPGAVSLAFEPSVDRPPGTMDEAVLRLEGPVARTVSLGPDVTTWRTDDLDPGTYSIAVEGFASGDLVAFGEVPQIEVASRDSATATVRLEAFRVTLEALPESVVVGDTLTVAFTPVSGAVGYRVEWDDDPSFPSPDSLLTSAASARVPHLWVGTLHVRVRPRNRFGRDGRPSAARSTNVRDRWIQLAAGSWHTCGLRASGTAYCWGNGEAGQLGSGSTGSPRPEAVLAEAAFAAIFVGELHSCALTVTGRAWCWGAGWGGQLGDGDTAPRPTPVAVSSEVPFSTLSLGGGHTCGLTPDGAAWCWGFGAQGQLGHGRFENAPRPVAVAGGPDGGPSFTAISAGAWHTCAVTDAGAAWCWGLGSDGQLGDGSLADRSVPVPVAGAHTFAGITARPATTSGSYHTCALTPAGEAWCWGSGWGGQLGDDSTTDRIVPVRVSGVGFSQLSAGEGHTCGVALDGDAWCWGFGRNGQLGTGDTADRLTPAPVAGGLAFRSVSSGAWHTCGVTTTGDAYCWGLGSDGLLGNGTMDDRWEPAGVIEP